MKLPCPSCGRKVSPAMSSHCGGCGCEIAVLGQIIHAAHDSLLLAVLALREYAEDWVDRLFVAPNHAGHWGLVQLVALSDDEQLATWLGRPEPTAKP